MLRHFDEELRELRQQMLSMAGMAEQLVGKAVRALVDRDAPLAEEAIREDEVVNQMEIEIEEACVGLLARFQPEAKDLRLITMAFKIVNDLERVADQGVNVAERTLDLVKEPLLKPLIDIPRMAALALQMLKDALDAFVNQNVELAREVCRRDEEVDRLNGQVCQELLASMAEDPKAIHRAVDLILIGRHLERVADHATNIAEDVYYFVKGATIKHRLAGT